jgi:hypothetical protein
LNVGVKESQASSDATKSNPESITALPAAICDPLGADEKLYPLRCGRPLSQFDTPGDLFPLGMRDRRGAGMPCGYFDEVGDMSL